MNGTTVKVRNMEREAKVQDALKDAIEAAAKKLRFDGLEITRVERDYPVDRRTVDLAVFARPETPFIFIETKRKGRERESSLFDPSDISVVGQAISYVVIMKEKKGILVPYFGTANPSIISIFKTPEDVEKMG